MQAWIQFSTPLTGSLQPPVVPGASLSASRHPRRHRQMHINKSKSLFKEFGPLQNKWCVLCSALLCGRRLYEGMGVRNTYGSETEGEHGTGGSQKGCVPVAAALITTQKFVLLVAVGVWDRCFQLWGLLSQRTENKSHVDLQKNTNLFKANREHRSNRGTLSRLTGAGYRKEQA